MASNASVALLLEDEPLIALDIEAILEGAGFDVTTVMSCADASDWLDSCRPDIVVVDIILTDGPCHAIVEKLIEAHIPFIVHSGDHPSMHVGTPFAHGRWVSKPADGDELAAVALAILASA